MTNTTVIGSATVNEVARVVERFRGIVKLARSVRTYCGSDRGLFLGAMCDALGDKVLERHEDEDGYISAAPIEGDPRFVITVEADRVNLHADVESSKWTQTVLDADPVMSASVGGA